MTHQTTQPKITSYDVPAWIKDRINVSAYEEIEAWRNSVKAPAQCKPGDPDLQIWWACESVLTERRATHERLPEITDHQVAVIEWVNSPAYDEE